MSRGSRQSAPLGKPCVSCPPEDRSAFTREMEREMSLLVSGQVLNMIGKKPGDVRIPCSQCGKGCWADAARLDIIQTQGGEPWCWYCLLTALKVSSSFLAVTAVTATPPPFMRERMN